MKLDKESSKKFGIKVFQDNARSGARQPKKTESSKKRNTAPAFSETNTAESSTEQGKE